MTHVAEWEHNHGVKGANTNTHQGCCMISGTVMRFLGSSSKMRLSRSRASGERALTLSAMKGDSDHVLLTSCSLHVHRQTKSLGQVSGFLGLRVESAHSPAHRVNAGRTAHDGATWPPGLPTATLSLKHSMQLRG